jgi:hypothetical protein
LDFFLSSSSLFVFWVGVGGWGAKKLTFSLPRISPSTLQTTTTTTTTTKQRDGKPAECVVFYSPRDVARIKHLLRMSGGGAGGGRSSYASKKARYERGCVALERMRDWCVDADTCRHAGLLRHFGESMRELGGRCGGSCDVCRGEVVREADPMGEADGRGSAAAAAAARERKGRRVGKKARASDEAGGAGDPGAVGAGGGGGGGGGAPFSFVSAASLLAAGGGGGGGGGGSRGRTTTAGRGRGRGRGQGGAAGSRAGGGSSVGNLHAPPPSLRAAAAAHLRAGNRHAEASTFVSAAALFGSRRG